MAISAIATTLAREETAISSRPVFGWGLQSTVRPEPAGAWRGMLAPIADAGADKSIASDWTFRVRQQRREAALILQNLTQSALALDDAKSGDLRVIVNAHAALRHLSHGPICPTATTLRSFGALRCRHLQV